MGECLVRQRTGSVKSVQSVPKKKKTPTKNYQLSTINYQLSTKKKSTKKEMNKETWSKILHFIITVLTAIATTFGVTSCMGI